MKPCVEAINLESHFYKLWFVPAGEIKVNRIDKDYRILNEAIYYRHELPEPLTLNFPEEWVGSRVVIYYYTNEEDVL